MAKKAISGNHVTCSSCGWGWSINDSKPSDKYVCHQCGKDNANATLEDGGWLDKFEPGGTVAKTDATQVNKQLVPLKAKKVTQKELDAREAQERRSRINVANAVQPFQYSSPKNFAVSTSAIADKLRFSDSPNSFDDSIFNPIPYFGEIASGLGQVPLNIQQGNYGQAALSVIEPLATGALMGVIEVPKNNFQSEIDEVGSIFKGKPLSDKEKEMYKFFDAEERFDKLPLTNNKQSLEVLENFKQRINTIEGKQRLKELGITEKQFLDDLQIKEDLNTYGYYTGNKNKIVINPLDPLIEQTTRHEIEHSVQNAIQKNAYKNEGKLLPTIKKLFTDPLRRNESLNSQGFSNIDNILSDLKLRNEATPNKVWKGHVDHDSPVNMSDLPSLLKNRQNATDYFLTGSNGKEKSAFLGEVQEYMMKTGVIPKNSYVNVTPEMVKNTFVDSMFDENLGGKYLRLFNIMKSDPKNYELISKGLNKMLSVTPIGLGLGAASQMQRQEVPKQRQGGVIKDDRGQWDHPGEITQIGSNQITMQGVPYPVLGISDTGDQQMMYPNQDYQFDGESVTEYPMMKNGGWLDKYNDGGPIQPNYNDANVSMSEDFVGMGNDTTGRNYSPAWGGQFADGGELPNVTVKGKRQPTPSRKIGNINNEDIIIENRNVRKQPIVVTNPKDPRLKAYNDSLSAYNANEKWWNSHNYKPVTKQILHELGLDREGSPYLKELGNPNNVYSPNENPVTKYDNKYNITYKNDVKKPKQPVIYRKPKPTPASVTNWLEGNGYSEDFVPETQPQMVYPNYGEIRDPRTGYTHMTRNGQPMYPLVGQKVPEMMMGGSLPGATGFMYARTNDPAPSNGKYAKKTMASAQNGQEMKFYQEGLDWKPRSMEQGGQLTKLDKLTNYNKKQPGGWLDKYQ